MKKFLLFLTLQFVIFSFGRSQISIDGNITRDEWGPALGSSAGGPSSSLGTGHELNALYASMLNNTDLFIAIAGNVQLHHRILLFIDSRPGGFQTTNFGREQAPAGLFNLNQGIRFDQGFEPDYCLVIGTNSGLSDFLFDLFSLQPTGLNKFLGHAGEPHLAASPVNNQANKGFEIKLSCSQDGPGSDIQYLGDNIKLMAMYISETGVLANQFISPAAAGEASYGNEALNFANLAPDPIVFRPNQILPMQFIGIDGRVIEEKSLIYWVVESDAEIDHYELEESDNGSVFKTLRIVPSLRNLSRAEYFARDDNLSIGSNFYRIKAIADNGRIIISQIIRMSYGKIDNSLFIFPNPVRGILNIQLHGVIRGNYKLHIYTNAGQEIYSEQVNHDGTDKTLQVRLPASLQRGIYRILFINKYEFYKQKFTIE